MTFAMPEVTAGEAVRIADALRAVLRSCWIQALDEDRARREARAEWTTCITDGCLVHSDEVCPACRAKRFASRGTEAA